MERVSGFGGFFFRAKDPEALTKWYKETLGVGPLPDEGEYDPWKQEAGPTVFSPFEQNTEYFGDASKGWMLNFRVRDLAAMTAQLRAAGIEVTPNDDETYGKFARIHDPEGNPIELWQPNEE